MVHKTSTIYQGLMERFQLFVCLFEKNSLLKERQYTVIVATANHIHEQFINKTCPWPDHWVFNLINKF